MTDGKQKRCSSKKQPFSELSKSSNQQYTHKFRRQQNLVTATFPYIKDIVEKIQRICNLYNIKTIFKSVLILSRYLTKIKLSLKENMTKKTASTTFCTVVAEMKPTTPLNKYTQSRLDHVWKEMRAYQSLWNEVTIIEKEQDK